MKRKSAICATMLVSAFVANADGARFLSENAGATVDVAADYLLPANWNNEVVGNAAGRDVTFDARATYGFVKLSDDVSVGAFSGFNNLVLFGDRAVTVTANGQTYARIQNARMYADIAVPSGVNMESYDSLSICGDVSVSGYSRYVGNTLFRADLYAKSSDSVRTTPWRTGDLNMSGNYVWYYAPRGSGAVSGTWSQADGSPYLFPVDATDAISVGTTVSGDGIRPGSFLKRIFPDGSIELSMPVTTTVSANTVTFAAFNPDFTQVHAAWRCIGPGKIGLVKYREQDSARLVFSGYTESTTLTDFQALVKLGEGQNGFSYSDYAANDGTCGGYLFAHMRTGRECGHLYFDVSRDGLTWTQLNGGREIPLSPSYFGHPYITEDDHGEFYLIGAHRFHDQGPPPLVLRQLPQVRRQGDGDAVRPARDAGADRAAPSLRGVGDGRPLVRTARRMVVGEARLAGVGAVRQEGARGRQVAGPREAAAGGKRLVSPAHGQALPHTLRLGPLHGLRRQARLAARSTLNLTTQLSGRSCRVCGVFYHIRRKLWYTYRRHGQIKTIRVH